MASAGCSVVLRVKRKRTEDPAEALVVRAKKIKWEPGLEGGTPQGEHVFNFCGTLPDKNEDCAKAVMELISKRKPAERKPLKQSAFARLTISHYKDQQRELKKESATSQRYCLVAKRRCMPEVDQQDASETTPASKKLEDLLHMYEVVQENGGSLDRSTGKEPASTSNGLVPCSDGAITCNSSVMTREKVNVHPPDGFAYDIYYSKHSIMPDPDVLDWTSLAAYDESPMYVHDVISSDEEFGGDEDDSNDENHWKNDYPDEGDWSSDQSSLGSQDDPSSNPPQSFRFREPYFDETDPFEDDLDYHRLGSWQDAGENSYDSDSLEGMS